MTDQDDLTQYLDPCFSDDATRLSPSRIVELICPEDSTSVSDSKLLRQQLFASPIISFLYERTLPPLWSAGLRVGGPEEEYAFSSSFLNGEGIAPDLSCGSGFVGRRMAASKKYKHVFLLDYSLQMLDECQSTITRQDEEYLPMSLIRGDAGQLPFRDATMDAVH